MPSSAAPTASPTASPTVAPVVSVSPSRTVPAGSTPTTSSAPHITTGQTQPPGAVVILPIKKSDQSPAAARAVDTAAAFLAAEIRVYHAGNTDALAMLSAKQCAACQREIKLLDKRLGKGQRIVDSGGLGGYKYTEIKYLGSIDGVSSVQAYVVENPAKLVDSKGSILQSTTQDTRANVLFTIADRGGRPIVNSFTAKAG